VDLPSQPRLVLSPVYGPITAFLGAIVGKTLTEGGVGLFFTPLAHVTAFVASTLSRPRLGWRPSALAITLLITGWYLTPVGRAAYAVPVLHLAGLLVVLAFRGRIGEMIGSSDRRTMSMGLLPCSFPSTLAGHLLSNIIFAVMFSPSAEFFTAVLPISAVERAVISVLATLFEVSLVTAVRLVYPTLMD
jgi:hypothetical protein